MCLTNELVHEKQVNKNHNVIICFQLNFIDEMMNFSYNLKTNRKHIAPTYHTGVNFTKSRKCKADC